MDWPRFSIVVPTYRRPRQLDTCLAALGRLEYPRERIEVVVVDDGSPEPLDPVVAAHRERLAVTLLRQANAGPAAARNHGASRATGDYIAFIDDDCAPGSDYLKHMAAAAARAPGAALGGRTLNAVKGNACSMASQLLIDYIYERLNSDPASASFFASNNLAVPAQGFGDCPFDTDYPLAAAEDRDWCDRWLAGGRRLVYVPDAVVRHGHVMSVRSFCRQHYNYGRGAHRFHGERDARGATPVRVDLGFYFGLVGYPFRTHRGLRAAQLSTLMFLSQAANVAGFMREKLRRGRAERPVER